MTLHPFLVHFPIAFWLFGSLLLCLSMAERFAKWEDSAWLMLTAGAVMGIAAAIAGQEDYELMAHLNLQTLEDHRDWGNLLPWLMGACVLLHFHSRFAKKGAKLPKKLFPILALIISGLVVYVGFLGGATVYEHHAIPSLEKVEKKMKISVAPPEIF